jgi:iron complex outermembrane receptor protein
LNYQFTDRFNLTGGLRWFSYDEERTLNFDGIFADRTIGLEGETDSDGYSPRVIAHYHATDNVQMTAQVSKGFRLGGINDPLNKPLCSAEDLATFGGFDAFEDEELTNYEVGAKMDLMDGRSQVNLAVYYSEIEDLQATLDAGTCSSRIVYNVPDAHVQGVEFEWFTTPVDGLDLALTGTWTQEAELDSTVTSTDASGNITVLGGLEEGNQLPTAPEFQMAASFTYSWPFCCTGIEGFVNGTWQYVGERWTQFADQDASGVVTMIPLASEPLSQATYSYDPEMDSYDLLNLRFGMRCDTWEAALFVNNALDEDAELALDRERGFRARQGYLTNQPRTVGLTGRYMF